MRAFFIQKFVQSQNVTRKKAYIRKRRAKNVDDIDYRVATYVATEVVIVTFVKRGLKLEF
jgi:hypothetical protein